MDARTERRSATRAGRRRTQGHVHGELGALAVERIIVTAGFTAERVIHDYGIDLTMKTLDRQGQPENGEVPIQVKSRARFRRSGSPAQITFRAEGHHVRLWRTSIFPVMLALYDVGEDRVYYFMVPRTAKATRPFRVPVSHVLTKESIHDLRRVKNDIQIKCERMLRGIR